MKIKRAELVARLELVSPGFTKEATLEQSDCFIFDKGRLLTLSEQMACSIDSPFDFDGAIQADRFLKLLKKLKDSDLDLKVEGDELLLMAKNKRAGFGISRITMPLDYIPSMPDEWYPFDFAEQLATVAGAVSKDENYPAFTCVHFTPNFVEACDNYQLVRYLKGMPLDGEFLLRGKQLKHVATAMEIGVSDNWICFRAGDLVLSYPMMAYAWDSMDEHLDIKGEPVSIPSAIVGAVEKAQLLSVDDDVMIDLREGRAIVIGRTETDWYKERATVDYDGPNLRFMIRADLVQRISFGRKCIVSPGAVRMELDDGMICACWLAKVE
jgi:hypothetical protein